MSTTPSTTELKERCEQLVKIVAQQKRKIAHLQTAPTSGGREKNEVFSFLKMYRDFLRQSQEQEWRVSRKNNTRASQQYVDIDFAKFNDFLSTQFDREDRHVFKQFLQEMHLVEEESFNPKNKIFAGSGKERKRVVRVPVKVYKWLSEDAG